ncbi:MAG: hypothetical protein ACOYLE_03545 [Bacteroidales bacterium]
MNKTLITFFIFMLLIQSCFAIHSFALPKDSIKTEGGKSKFDFVMGIGVVQGGFHLGSRYNINKHFSTEMFISLIGLEIMVFGNANLQLGGFVNYKPIEKNGFMFSTGFSFFKQPNNFYVDLFLVQDIGYVSNYNKKGVGWYIRGGVETLYNTYLKRLTPNIYPHFGIGFFIKIK